MARDRQGILAALAVLVALALPGASAAADTAPQGWVPHGERISGTARSGSAPRLTAGHTYQDTLAKGGTKYYAIRLDARSSAYLSVFAVPPRGSRVGFLDGVSLKLSGRDGTPCDAYDARFGADGAVQPVGGAVVRTIRPDGGCQQAGDYLLSVQRVNAAASSAEDWPLDIRYMSEPPVSAVESGPVQSYTTATPPVINGSPTAVTGAPDMDGDTARLPGSGVYQDHLAPGETHFYRIPVDWGQRLVATAEFANAGTTGSGGFSTSGVRLVLYNPARGLVSDATASYSGAQAAVTAQTPTVDYLNRDSTDVRVNSAPVAGWYYAQLSLHPDVAKYTTGGVDVTLRLAVTGTRKPGPHYTGDATSAGFGVTADSTSGDDGGATPNRMLLAVGYGGVVTGTLLVAGLAVWAVRARRR
ncbi:hypothetical protein ACFOSC_14400 [Streptantibioticus rubrisoli]|uniref:Uncharacterized protein n=1 Tax=Streptantibioticus rubrisoli TaxID=1387313 RepID=A0ABT1PD55_9ACTN|nr:hypothetical protein [Streptantibioticus rubrisoli]MCQ4042163.1 hypothetical protein [Streptantibioticus rubrisoli]